ncbi:MAG: hypothetical protein Q9204_001379, partial [Flavoplaca sp. TL-2023a]
DDDDASSWDGIDEAQGASDSEAPEIIATAASSRPKRSQQAAATATSEAAPKAVGIKRRREESPDPLQVLSSDEVGVNASSPKVKHKTKISKDNDVNILQQQLEGLKRAAKERELDREEERIAMKHKREKLADEEKVANLEKDLDAAKKAGKAAK